MDRVTKLFLAGIGIVALRIADDSFIQPPAGTTPLDHLASGLIPLAALAAAAIAFPRLGSIGRGFVALLVGVAGVVTGGDAFYYSVETGIGSEDLSGFAAMAAGIGLLGLGGTVLWRGRRLDQSRGRRYGKRSLLAVGAALFASLLLFPVVVAYFNTHLQDPKIPGAHLGVAHREIELETSDGLKLDGWYVPPRNGAAVVVFPGRRESAQSRARMLAANGYGVVLLDRRGEGGSEGAPNGFGWGGHRDIAAAVAYLRAQPEVDDDRIAGLGLSVGGEMMLDLAAEPDDGLAAVISEGAGTRSWAEEQETSEGNLLGAPTFITKTAALAVFSDTAPPRSMLDVIPDVAPTPLFLISSRDAKNETLAPRYEEIAPPGTATWSIPGDNHMGGIEVAPEAYERRVIRFLERSFDNGH
jgi:alpha/beta superfamily hydrolase